MIERNKTGIKVSAGRRTSSEEDHSGIQRGKTVLSSSPDERRLHHLLSQAAYLLAKPAVRRVVVEPLVPHHVVIESPNLRGGCHPPDGTGLSNSKGQSAWNGEDHIGVRNRRNGR
jgi:hypothetical protein